MNVEHRLMYYICKKDLAKPPACRGCSTYASEIGILNSSIRPSSIVLPCSFIISPNYFFGRYSAQRSTSRAASTTASENVG